MGVHGVPTGDPSDPFDPPLAPPSAGETVEFVVRPPQPDATLAAIARRHTKRLPTLSNEFIFPVPCVYTGRSANGIVVEEHRVDANGGSSGRAQ